ncbi:uncharacterized protein P174DRAFT_288998 [Aspergillus novofumigatus IBT 16806]|uniref:Secreted protein n=1 Tax=Aspergillus novofumigatus (strain IBT 16806) TaxID=1392255 RepID=A0A2I1BXF5_ASPN1|nr:uncharacterized protein P174DRAFT_288998 [Aspergillus novofumigatus IBT 16806]PKX90064.1 hypothetical protein P174DRAFT_288998 [Aspergillus novofumigatus IBT 16806]
MVQLFLVILWLATVSNTIVTRITRRVSMYFVICCRRLGGKVIGVSDLHAPFQTKALIHRFNLKSNFPNLVELLDKPASLVRHSPRILSRLSYIN